MKWEDIKQELIAQGKMKADETADQIVNNCEEAYNVQ
jgi:hypothetical protein